MATRCGWYYNNIEHAGFSVCSSGVVYNVINRPARLLSTWRMLAALRHVLPAAVRHRSVML
jgi:hypothetical protein